MNDPTGTTGPTTPTDNDEELREHLAEVLDEKEERHKALHPRPAIKDLEVFAEVEDAPELKRLLHGFQSVAEEIVTNYRVDRNQIEQVVQHLIGEVITNHSTEEVMVESLVNALKVKTDTNTNITRILDSISRMISATKTLGIFDGEEGGGEDWDLDSYLTDDE